MGTNEKILSPLLASNQGVRTDITLLSVRNFRLELRLAFGRDVTKERLKTMGAIELLAGVLAGAVRFLELDSNKMHGFDFKVLNAKHCIQEVYEVDIVVSANFRSSGEIRQFTRHYSVLGYLGENSVQFKVLQLVFDLIGSVEEQ